MARAGLAFLILLPPSPNVRIVTLCTETMHLKKNYNLYNSEAALKKTYLIFIFSFVVWFYLREYPSIYIKFALTAVPLLFHFKGKCLLWHWQSKTE